MKNAVETENLGRTFLPSARQALKDLSFSVQAGEIFGVLGPNGGGKTTLFRILSTALLPSQGRATLFGLDVARDPAAVRRVLGVVFQSPSLDKFLTVRENMIHSGHLYGLAGSTLVDRVNALLAQFRLSDRAHERVDRLSGGLSRRVEVAKSLLHSPALLLLDEPTTGLDPGVRRDLWILLKELKGTGVTILVTTHLMDEADICDRLLILDEGKKVAEGTPAELKSHVGGDVILAHSPEPERLQALVREKFSLEGSLLDGAIRLERPRGHEFVPALVESFPGLIESIHVGKPTLEDVFIRVTGHSFK
jgi:ABC-2 type transport system ATP-binding protein